MKVISKETIQLFEKITQSRSKEINLSQLEERINNKISKKYENIVNLSLKLRNLETQINTYGLLDDNFRPKKELKNHTELYKEYKNIKEEYSKNKVESLEVFINCIQEENTKTLSRNTKYIKDFTNKATIDIDHISLQGKNINDIFYILSQDKYTKMIFISPSNDGIKIICNLDHPEGSFENSDVIEWYDYTYQKLREYYNKLTDLKIDDTKDIIRACFVPITSEVILKDSEPFKTYEDWKGKSILKVKSGKMKLNLNTTSESYKKLAEAFINYLKYNPQSVFSDYHEWVKLAFVLAYLYGKDGATIYLELSKYDVNFNPVSCNNQFNIALNTLDPSRLNHPEKWLFKKLTDIGYTPKQNELNLFRKLYFKESDYLSMMNDLDVKIYTDEMNGDKYISYNNKKEVRITDSMLNKVIVDLKLRFNDKLKKSELETYMFSEDNMISRHYLKERIEKLKYDKPDEFEKMLSYIITIQSDELKANTIKRWMLGAFKNVYEDYYDEILVLIGGQGKGKTTFINHFLKPFRDWTCSNFSFKPDNKDEIKKLVDNMFIYDSENIAFKKSEIEIIKKITSTHMIDYRTQYARFSTKLKRIATFIMDTNQEIIFNDDSGGRRYLILHINDLIIYPKQGSKLKEIDYEKVWGYIYNEYKNGLRQDDINVDEQNEYREQSRLKKDLELIIEDIFTDDEDGFISVKEITNIIRSHISLEQTNLLKGEFVNASVGRMMSKLFKSKMKKIDGKSTRGYKVIAKDAIEIKNDSVNTLLDSIIDNGGIITEEQKRIFNKLTNTINKLK